MSHSTFNSWQFSIYSLWEKAPWFPHWEIMSHGKLSSRLLTQTTYSFQVHWRMSQVPSLEFRSWILWPEDWERLEPMPPERPWEDNQIPFFLWNASWICLSSLCKSHAQAVLFQLSICAVKVSMITKHFYLFIYLVVPGLSCTHGIFDLHLWGAGSLVVACELFVCGMWDQVPWPEIRRRPPAVRVQSLKAWSTREVPSKYFLPPGTPLVTSASCALHVSCWFWVSRNSQYLFSEPGGQHSLGHCLLEEVG